MRTVMALLFAPWLFLTHALAEEIPASAASSATVDAAAPDPDTAAQAQLQALVDSQQQFIDSLKPQTGDVVLPGGVATLHLGEKFYYLAPDDTQRVLEDAWGNPDGSGSVGMVFPAGVTPFDESWGAILTLSEEGYVEDKDAADIDYDELLATMKEESQLASEEREKQGLGKMVLVGWAAQPFYDQERHTLHWAKDFIFDDMEEHTLNYNVRSLGRRGVLEMNFVATMDQLPNIQADINEVLAIPEFNEGHRYSDFDPSMDEVAAYGIGALIAGKAAAKFGLLAAALLFLKKFWFLGAAAVAVLWRWLGGKKEPQNPTG